MTARTPSPPGGHTTPAADLLSVGDAEDAGPVALEVFGDTLPVAARYADLLAGDGVAHGHLGPREAGRLWSRHLLNCAVVTDLLPLDATVVDVGSGAGLPGLAMAIRRPDLRVTLVEPMQRRIDFLARCIGELDLTSRVFLVHGRADEAQTVAAVAPARWLTARAVAPLDRLVRWCLPLLAADGEVLAMKGRSAQDEVERLTPQLRRAGAEVRSVAELAVGDDVTRVVVMARAVGVKRSPGDRRGGR